MTDKPAESPALLPMDMERARRLLSRQVRQIGATLPDHQARHEEVVRVARLAEELAERLTTLNEPELAAVLSRLATLIVETWLYLNRKGV